MTSKLDIVAVSRAREKVLLSDWQTEIPFNCMYDEDGNETDDASEAIVAVVELNEKWWAALELAEWEGHEETVH
jgi:LDH2 family malate/lactate/ureidoglycolate dehydrogenase